MSAYEELRLLGKEHRLHSRCIPPGIAAYVRHQHLHTLSCEDFHLFEAAAKHGSIYVAIHGPHHRGYTAQAVEYFLAAYVAGVPYLVATGKVCRIAVVPPGVGVR